MKKKILLGAFLAAAMSFALSTSTSARMAAHNTCKGYKWKSCNGGLVIRCTCTGGSTCWAAWQDLC